MAFNRKIWLKWKIRKPCPACLVGTLQPQENKKGLLYSETSKSIEWNSEHASDYTEYLFSMHLKCNNCEETVAVSGTRLEENYDNDQASDPEPMPVSFYPAPKIIDIPDTCPKSVSKILNESFGLYWIDISSCANKIRIAIEVILNEFGVKSKNGEKNISLHNRIIEFAKKQEEPGEHLLAIKWIGNSGSHFSNIKKEDVLDAYELLEYSLELLFPDRKNKLTAMSKQINKEKKPIKK